MKIKVLLDVKDITRFSIISIYTKASYQFFACMCLLSILTLPFTGLRMNFSSSYDSPVIQVLLFRLILPLVVLISPFASYFNINKRIQQDKRLSEEVEYYVSGFGIMSESTSFTSNRTWKEIIKVDETIWYFSIFVSDNQAILIPKRFFQDANLIDEFKDILKKHLPKKVYR